MEAHATVTIAIVGRTKTFDSIIFPKFKLKL